MDTLLKITYSLNAIGDAASRFWEVAKQYRIITFSGDMGAGKTTFISSLCSLLGVQDAVSSPTFALINEYVFYANNKEETIYHLDWYRLKGTEEAINAGMEECIIAAGSNSAYTFIEWPEIAPDLLRKPYIAVQIATTGADERQMTVRLIN